MIYWYETTHIPRFDGVPPAVYSVGLSFVTGIVFADTNTEI